MGDVAPLKKPQLPKCANCGTDFWPRDRGFGRHGIPLYCSYGCGQEAQPNHRAATLRGERDPVEEK